MSWKVVLRCLLQDQKEANRQVCSGMYSRKSWGGNMDPFILTKLLKPKNLGDEDPIVSLVVFEWSDKDLIGVPIGNKDGYEQVRNPLRRTIMKIYKIG